MCENTKVSTYDKMTLKEISDSLKNKTDIELKNEEENLKFYRYFELKGEFDEEPDYNFEDLINGKLSLVNASLMNDKLDSTLNINFAELKNKQIDYLTKNKAEVFENSINNIAIHPFKQSSCFEIKGEGCKSSTEVIEEIISQVAKLRNNSIIGQDENPREYAKYLIKEMFSSSVIIEAAFSRIIDEWENYDKNIEFYAENYVNACKSISKRRFLRSLAKSYKNDAMWAYYAKNRGICVGYNLNKLADDKVSVTECGADSIILRKVSYRNIDKKPAFSAVEYFKSLVRFERCPEDLSKINKLYIDQITTKNTSWAHEKEWRLIYSDDGFEQDSAYSFDLDLVDAVYIDENILDNNKVERLLQVAKERGWTVHKRVLLTDRNAYDYPVLNEKDY